MRFKCQHITILRCASLFCDCRLRSVSCHNFAIIPRLEHRFYLQASIIRHPKKYNSGRCSLGSSIHCLRFHWSQRSFLYCLKQHHLVNSQVPGHIKNCWPPWVPQWRDVWGCPGVESLFPHRVWIVRCGHHEAKAWLQPTAFIANEMPMMHSMDGLIQVSLTQNDFKGKILSIMQNH